MFNLKLIAAKYQRGELRDRALALYLVRRWRRLHMKR